MAVEVICPHCGDIIEAPSRRDAEAKLRRHIQTHHGWI